MAASDVVIRGAREHNLRDVSLVLPRGRLICLTGVSGSGKSSLAFDTLYAEGQRRYVESLSSYARQFLGQMPKPQVDRIDGLSPSIAIQQKTGGRNPRSTVGTITEVADYLRVLYARVGRTHCPECGRIASAQSREQITARIREQAGGSPFLVLAPVVRGQKGEYRELFADLARSGYVRARVNGQVVNLTDELGLERQVKHNIEVVIDRFKDGAKDGPRLPDAVEQALKVGDGTLIAAIEGRDDLLLSSQYACPHCEISFDPPSPQLFSFNSPQGMCPECSGLGVSHDFDPELLVPDPDLSVWEGAIALVGPINKMGGWRKHLYEGVAANFESDPDGPPKGAMLKGPWRDLDERWRKIWLDGAGDRMIVHHWKGKTNRWAHGEKWRGAAVELREQYRAASGGPSRARLEPYMRTMTCPECAGARLNARARAVTVGGATLPDLGGRSIALAARFFEALATARPGDSTTEPGLEPLDPTSRTIAEELLKEIRARLGFLIDVGLHYLTLDRAAPSLSGGEAQRIRLASQVGAGLVGVLYVLDEPSIGLHPRDNDQLLATLKKLAGQGNTVIVVEHDEDTMRAADHLVDFGPGPGVKGGEVVAAGSVEDLADSPRSVTGAYLAGRSKIPVPAERKSPDGRWLTVKGARHNNLKGIDARFPLGLFICVTGVSGSGKSSLVGDVLREALAAALNGATTEPGAHDSIEGLELLDKMIDINQSPIGRTPRSNPVTYIKLFDQIRDLYTKLPDSKARGYAPGRFSFNVPGGRCEACEGNGSNRLEMDFLADVWVVCPVCQGKRFGRETLHMRFKGKSVSDVLDMDVQEALVHFANIPKIAAMLQTLHDVGLDYMKLGQPSPTLSGGEAQRVKLARELVKRGTGRTLYILDEPTTGLHFEDVRKLLQVLHGFKAGGNTVVVIEHNLDVVKTADWVIDLGPEGGAAGGVIVAEGAPETIAAHESSLTGRFLRRALERPKLKKSRAKPRRKPPSRSTEAGLDRIEIRQAAEHNLKGIDLDLPRDKMTVCAGPSGSGKSSLAIDTLYAEGQRRYVESLSSYARQFLAPLPKPKVERVGGLSPAICIEQKTTSKSPRSTVGTVTEIYDYLRILFARLGKAYCPKCNVPIGARTADQIVEQVLELPEETQVYVMAPVERGDGETYDALWSELSASGFARARVDGRSVDLSDPPKLSPRRKHRIEVVVDRAIVRRSTRARLADSIESALDLGKGVVHLARVGDPKNEAKWPVERYSRHRVCDRCSRAFDELAPHHFSFNAAMGWCPVCQGLGVQQGADPAVLVPDARLSLRQGAVAVWPDFATAPLFARMIEAVAAAEGIDPDLPFDDLDARSRRLILHGAGEAWYELAEPAAAPFAFRFKGLFPAVEEAGRVSFRLRFKLQGMVDAVPCATCMGARLRDDAAAVRFHEFTVDQITRWPLVQTLGYFTTLDLDDGERHIAGDLIREIRDRLAFLVEVGLDYLTLARGTATLSGGESQRIRLASQLGSGLTGVLYVLDEPTIGLHPRDNDRLLGALRRLRDLGNTLVLVEHDREILLAADHLVDFGPGAGREGGWITASGTPEAVKNAPDSLTGQYLSGRAAIPVPNNRRPITAASPAIVIKNPRQHNLKGADARIPVAAVVVVTGVSGSGKSSLVEDILYKAAARHFHRAEATPGAHASIEGLGLVNKVIRVDQSPLGATPASIPATYVGAFDLIRDLFAKTPEARSRGYTARRFSFNQAGGRCEVCEGAGQKRVEMHFLPDVWIACESCGGGRFTAETLAVSYRGKTIADVLAMTVREGLDLFEAHPKLKRILQTLFDVGLGYLCLGQSATTLSGGEAQRVKLAAELARPDTGKTLYILDEPTTGLHVDDVRKLLDVIHRLADLGNTVVIIEHNLEVIKTADWVIDLGPEAGARGGEIVAQGTPEAVARIAGSLTGKFLAPVLAAGPRDERPGFKLTLETTKAGAAKGVSKSAPMGVVVPDPAAVSVPTPWEKDGRQWHTGGRPARNGNPVRWDGELLGRIVDFVETLGKQLSDEIGVTGFQPAEWSERDFVRIRKLNQLPMSLPFLHATTAAEWVLTLRFYVPRRTFNQTGLGHALKLAPFHEVSPPVLSDLPRLTVRELGPHQEIAFTANSAAEFKSKEFLVFLYDAVRSALLSS